MTNEDYMNNELAELEAMTEKEACEAYNRGLQGRGRDLHS